MYIKKPNDQPYTAYDVCAPCAAWQFDNMGKATSPANLGQDLQ